MTHNGATFTRADYYREAFRIHGQALDLSGVSHGSARETRMFICGIDCAERVPPQLPSELYQRERSEVLAYLATYLGSTSLPVVPWG